MTTWNVLKYLDNVVFLFHMFLVLNVHTQMMCTLPLKCKDCRKNEFYEIFTHGYQELHGYQEFAYK